MADDVRRRQEIMNIAMENLSIRDYRPNVKDFEIPTWLEVPTQMQNGMNTLCQRAAIAIKSMRQVKSLQDKRYNALCPNSLGLIYEMHVYSMRRLLEWKEQSNPDDPTLAPEPKIPRDSLKFTLDPQAHQRFSEWYHKFVENFLAGPFSNYRQFKHELSITAAQIMDEHAYREWRHWWDGTFVPAMWKWEACLEGLILPTWEEVIDDVFLMILDRVEDSAELANSLCSSCSPPVTPPTPPSTATAEYFAVL